MTDEKKIIKEAIDDIKPDAYMKTRLMAKIEEPKKKSRKNILKPIVSCTLALAVLAGVGTYGMTRDKEPTTTQTSTAKALNHNFNIIAYAQDENGNQSENIALDDNDISTLENYKIKAYRDKDGYPTVETSSESGFNINADNVAEAIFESENGTFCYFDSLLVQKLVDEGKYYIVIPLTDDENKLYHEKYESKEREFYEYLSKSKDLSKYFDGQSQDGKHYAIYYDDFENKNTLRLTPTIYQSKLTKSDYKKLTVKTYRNGDVIQNVQYYPDVATNELIKNSDMNYEDLPNDIITITVKFKDGQQATKKIKTSFNSKGELQLQYVK